MKINVFQNLFYRGAVELARVFVALEGWKIRTSGEDNIPTKGGAVVVINHTGYMDFVFGGFIPRLQNRLVRYLTKAGIFEVKGVGAAMRAMGHIPVDRVDGSESFYNAVDLARAGHLVGVFAEGTISRSFEIRSMRTGAARIAHEAGVPIVPQVIFGSQRIWTKGQKKNFKPSKTPIFIEALEPFHPTGDAEADTAELRRRMQEGIEKLWGLYEAEFGEMPKGEFWVPARLDGGAPTLEEAEAADREVEAERYRERRLRDDLIGLRDRISQTTSELVHERLALPAKAQVEEVKRTAPETLEWIKDNLNAVVEEANRGIDESRGKVTEIMNSVKADIAEAQASLSTSSKEIFAGSSLEQGLLSAATQSRLIVSRLPHRMKANYSDIPRVLAVDETALLFKDGQLNSRLRQALEDVYPTAEVLVVMSAHAAAHDDDTIGADIPQALWRIEHNGAVVRQGGDVIAVHGIDAAQVEAIKAAAEAADLQIEWSTEGDEVVAGLAVGTVDGVREALGESAEGLQLNDDVNGVVITAASRLKAAAVVLENLEAAEEDALVFAGEGGDETFMTEATVVALETAPIDVVKNAESVTYSADKNGIAEVLEAMFRLQNKKK